MSMAYCEEDTCAAKERCLLNVPIYVEPQHRNVTSTERDVGFVFPDRGHCNGSNGPSYEEMIWALGFEQGLSLLDLSAALPRGECCCWQQDARLRAVMTLNSRRDPPSTVLPKFVKPPIRATF